MYSIHPSKLFTCPWFWVCLTPDEDPIWPDRKNCLQFSQGSGEKRDILLKASLTAAPPSEHEQNWTAIRQLQSWGRRDALSSCSIQIFSNMNIFPLRFGLLFLFLVRLKFLCITKKRAWTWLNNSGLFLCLHLFSWRRFRLPTQSQSMFLHFLCCHSSVSMVCSGLGTKEKKSIMFWLKIPVLVTTNTAEDVLTYHQICFCCHKQEIVLMSP